jgi:formiminotetrahydrofolate cyclodeaminase
MTGMAARDDVLDLSVRDFLASVSARTPAPAAGSVAAVVVGLAAGLVAMAARFSADHWDGALRAAEQAEELRLRSAPLVQSDADSYARVIEALRAPKEPDASARKAAIAEALSAAADVPLEIAEIGAEVARLAADVAAHGNANLRGDATGGAVLAEGSARIAATLVAINLSGRPDDERTARAAACASFAAEAAARALRRATSAPQ